MLNFDRQGLIPAVIQDDATNEVLMVAFMNEEAFARTRETIWRKGEQSGNVQEVRDIFVNCEENSLLIRVIQHGGAACHTGYRSCYYRRLLADGTYEKVAERVFDPEIIYGNTGAHYSVALEEKIRQLYGVYLYLRDHDLSEESNTSRLLQEHSQGYLVSRLGDELEELAEIQSGEHAHTGRQPDTILEGSQVGYWLLLLAATKKLRYDEFMPHASILQGYYAQYSTEQAIEQQQQCLSLAEAHEAAQFVEGLQLGFALVGWACAAAGVSPL